MTTPNPRICGPADDAPTVTDLVAHCDVCGVTWAVRSLASSDAEGCSFCDAPASAVTMFSESPDYSGIVI